MTTDPLAPVHVSKALGANPSLLDGGKRPKILVVDDDPSVRSLLYDVLSETGYDVDTAADGAQGLLLFELARPDLVILDLVMPRLAGWELAERICEIDARVPIVALTGFAAALSFLLQGRGVVLVHKPVNLSELTDVLRSLLGRGEETEHQD